MFEASLDRVHLKRHGGNSNPADYQFAEWQGTASKQFNGDQCERRQRKAVYNADKQLVSSQGEEPPPSFVYALTEMHYFGVKWGDRRPGIVKIEEVGLDIRPLK